MPEQIPITKESILLAAVREASRSKGCENFMFLFSPRPGEQMYHLESMQLDTAVGMLTSALRMFIEDEMKKNPKYTPEYKKLFSDFLTDMKGAIADHNKRMKEFIQKNNP